MKKKAKLKNPDIKVKVGLLTTVAKSIYADTHMKLREAVANAMDNAADNFIFTLKKNEAEDKYILSLFDDGIGISKDKIKKILESLGYGLHRDDTNAQEYYSYFGLGLMSVFQLGSKVTIITKPKGVQEVNKLVVNSRIIFSKEMEKEHIDVLKKYFDLTDSSSEERNSMSPLSAKTIKDIIGKLPDCFTEIIIDGLNEDDISNLTDEASEEKIQKILPLEVDKKNKFLLSLKKDDKTAILTILSDNNLCKKIAFYFSIDGKTPHRLVTKYFPDFLIPYSGDNYVFYSGKKAEFAYYFLAAGKDRGVKEGKDRETGIWIRNKNFLVKAADYLQQYQGSKAFIRDPIKNWIFGEIFHDNMNDFLEVSRKDFIVSSERFKRFRSEVKEIVQPISEEMSDAYDVANEVVKIIREPYDTLENDKKSPFRKLEKNIADIEKILLDDIVGDKATEILKKLDRIKSKALESSPDLISKIKEKKEPIIIVEEENYHVVIDPKASEEIVKYNHNKKRVDAIIPSKIFEAKEITLFGKAFSVRYKDGRKVDKGISFDTKAGEIFVNPFFRDFKKHSISFLDVVIASEYVYQSLADDSKECANAKTLNCMENMKDLILEFLGVKYESLPKYVDSLGNYLSKS